jgi:hypothetical protein
MAECDLSILGIVGGLPFEDAKSGDVLRQIRFLHSYQLKLVVLSSHENGPFAFQSAFGKIFQTLNVGETLQVPYRD